jgi:hypothetical protein
MAHKKVDRVQQTTSGVGTGALILDGAAPARMRTFANTLSDGDTCWVLIEHSTLAEWEISLATYSGGYISRSFVAGSSSSTGSLISFSGGVKTVSLIAPAGATPIVNGDGDMSVPRDLWIGRNAAIVGNLTAAGAAFTDPCIVPGVAFSLAGDQYLYDSGTGNATMRVGQGGADVYFTFGTDGVIKAESGFKFGNAEQYLYSPSGSNVAIRAGASGGEKYWSFTSAGLFDAQSGGGKFNGDIYPAADNAFDCGRASERFANIRSVNGTIVTSDGEDKDNIDDLIAAEIAVGRRLRIHKWQMKDAITKKGAEHARWHTGWVAQEVAADFQAEGLDAFKYGCVGFDLLEKVEAYTETVMRPKTEPYEHQTSTIEIVDGVPVRRTTTAVARRPVGTMVAVRDEQGAVVMSPTGAKDEDGQLILAPLLHFVPEMEEVQEERTRMVPDLDEHGVQKKRMNVRPDELKAFVLAALMADVGELKDQVAALTSA